jgi:hypothetical protein
MIVAVNQISVGEYCHGIEENRTNELIELLNRCGCDTQGWHYFPLSRGHTVLDAAHFVRFVQENRLKWQAYDVVLLLLEQRFIKDITLCSGEVRAMLKHGDKLLVGFDFNGKWPEVLAWRPRGTSINQLCAKIIECYGKQDDLGRNIAEALNQMPEVLPCVSSTLVAKTEGNALLVEDVLLAASNVSKVMPPKYYNLSYLLKVKAFPPRRYDSTEKSAQEIVMATHLVKSSFLYERIGYDVREMSFLPDGKVAVGAAGLENFWDVEILSEAKPILSLSSESALTCEFTLNEDESWSGEWLRFEKMPVALRPQLNSDTRKDSLCITNHAVSEQKYKVVSENIGYDPETEYDINVSVLVHCNDRYVARAYAFLKHGLVNLGPYRVHALVIGSLGDRKHFDLLRKAAPKNIDISFLEMGSRFPVPKINGHYFWLFQSQLRARWHLRVDDDSITDVSALIQHVDTAFGKQPIHLMTSPCEKEIGGPLFETFAKKNGFHLDCFIHEYESSISSSAAFQAVSTNQRAIDFMVITAKHINAPGDRALAFAMQLAGVPVAPNPRSTKDYNSSFSLIGGQYYHIHYVNWENRTLQEFLAIYTHGRHARTTSENIHRFMEVPLLWQHAMGTGVCTIVLRRDGTGRDCTWDEPLLWRHSGNGIQVLQYGVIKASFDEFIEYGSKQCLIGVDLMSNRTIYLSEDSTGSGQKLQF